MGGVLLPRVKGLRWYSLSVSSLPYTYMVRWPGYIHTVHSKQPGRQNGMVGIRGAQEGELVAELGGLTISQQLKSMVHHRLNICSKLT